MTVPTTLFENIVVQWVIPNGITEDQYNTVNIYRSALEAQNYILIASVPFMVGNVPRTSYVDTYTSISDRGSYFYMVVFSHSATGLVSGSYMTYKALSPREQRMVLQMRDSMSRFISNRLADEELRQYIDQGLQNFNVYSPTTYFNIFNLPPNMEALVLLGSTIMGVANNMLGIGFTDIAYSDQGFSLTATRMEKMSTTFDKVLGAYNNLLAIAKLDYAEGPQGVGTVMLPIGMGGNINRGILNVFDLLSAVGR